MVYYNADGELGSLCGNGSRCALAFAYEIGRIEKKQWVSYMAFGGQYLGRVNGNKDVSIEVPVHQAVVKSLGDDQFFVDTGSPHFIILEKPDDNWIQEACLYRWDKRFQPDGCNVNYVWQETSSDQITSWHIRTYERGVEAPTEACGTGNIAAFLVLLESKFIEAEEVLSMQNPGGVLSTFFRKNRSAQDDEKVVLSGPAEKAFEGSVKIQ
jgi:diaminopimelate epimerase